MLQGSGVPRSETAPRLLASKEQGRELLSPTRVYTGQARHPKSCFLWGSKGREGVAFQKSSKMQICLHLGTGQDHFCFLQPRLKACTFQVMKSATHFEWKIQFMWIDLFCKWHVKRAFWRHYIFQIFSPKIKKNRRILLTRMEWLETKQNKNHAKMPLELFVMLLSVFRDKVFGCQL